MPAYNEKKTLRIIRHGETEFNKLNIVQGSGVDTALNETGLKQAGLFYQNYRHLPFDRIYTSMLRRSIQSVQSFIDAGLPHTALPELNEISWGDFEGKYQSDEQKQIYWEIVNRWKMGDMHAKIPNGESPYELQLRQKAAVHQILKQENDKNILICMHGRAMKSFMCLLLEQPINQMEDYQHSNLCMYHLEYDGTHFELISANDTQHLQPSSTIE